MISFVMPCGYEFGIIGAIGLLLFGHRLPKIARSAGSTIVEFKRGLRSGEKEGIKLDLLEDKEEKK